EVPLVFVHLESSRMDESPGFVDEAGLPASSSRRTISRRDRESSLPSIAADLRHGNSSVHVDSPDAPAHPVRCHAGEILGRVRSDQGSAWRLAGIDLEPAQWPTARFLV